MMVTMVTVVTKVMWQQRQCCNQGNCGNQGNGCNKSKSGKQNNSGNKVNGGNQDKGGNHGNGGTHGNGGNQGKGGNKGNGDNQDNGGNKGNHLKVIEIQSISSPGSHLLPSSVTMSSPLIRCSRNSAMLSDSGSRPDNPEMTNSFLGPCVPTDVGPVRPMSVPLWAGIVELSGGGVYRERNQVSVGKEMARIWKRNGKMERNGKDMEKK